MRFVGIDVGAERHVVASVDAAQAVGLNPTGFTEDAAGYPQLLTLLGPATDTLVAMEATGHYWKNVFAVLVAQGFAVALLNPLRTRRVAAEALQRTKTDAIDADVLGKGDGRSCLLPPRQPGRPLCPPLA